MVSLSIITTVYNRPKLTLMNTFSKLARNDLRDSELIVVDDGSTVDYREERDFCLESGLSLTWVRVDTASDRPGSYSIDGSNNPSYAWNCALDAATGRKIAMLSSDCMVPPYALKKARKCGKSVWMSSVVDMDSGQVYLGPSRIAPFGWFACWDREVVGDIRQDEEYLKGMCYDDNDFSAQLGLSTGRVEIDTDVTAFHQSHPPIAYTDELAGMRINERYTRRKWGGIPWSRETGDPLRVSIAQGRNRLVVDVEMREAKIA